MTREPPASAPANRLRIDKSPSALWQSRLAADVRRGLSAEHKALPPKYFYDDRGARLFDAICDLPEYYLTRTEDALLDAVADDIAAATGAQELVEFGSGASRKTRRLLTALLRHCPAPRYTPMDVSVEMLRRSADALLDAYPTLRVHAVVGDYEHDLVRLPAGERRLVAFLGSTIGNFTPDEALRFLTQVGERLHAGEHFLLGVDLVKDLAVLHAAYNDAAGVTAEFNRNILRVVNRTLDAKFDPERFDHIAFFNPEASQIEMYLRAQQSHTVRIAALNTTIALHAGETIHTEISRKFTRAETEALLQAAGFDLVRWFEPPNGYFALALAARR